jgi:Zn finger protein HypA/HybF involved in hydrogenase expression
MNKDVATFDAKCAGCGKPFEHPSFGDFSYGENILYAASGRNQAWASAFSEFPQRLKSLLDTSQSKKFWDILASLADPIEGQKLVAKITCPHCSSDRLEYWDGKRIGLTSIQEATFSQVFGLDDSALVLKIAEAANASA